MTKQQKLLSCGAVFVLVVAVIIAWFVRAPYDTLQSIKTAAEHRDLAELNRTVDFPTLKSSIKMMVMDSVSASTGGRNTVGAGMARLFAGALAAPIIDAMVTPESIVYMFSGKFPRKTGQTQDVSQKPADGNDVTMTREWEGLSVVRFKMRSNTSEDQSLTFVMRRDGLSWRLSAIER